MSADNWSQCPRCLKRRGMEAENKAIQVEAAYEILGAEDGVVEVRYSGSCGTCNLRTEFKHQHVIDVDGAS